MEKILSIVKSNLAAKNALKIITFTNDVFIQTIYNMHVLDATVIAL